MERGSSTGEVRDFGRRRRPAAHGAAIVLSALLLGTPAAHAGFFDFLFGSGGPQPIFGNETPPAATAPPPRAEVGRSSGYCVRGCDGRYFQIQARGGATPAQMCQAFCPASPTTVYYGSTIDGAVAAGGARYADSENAFLYRKTLKPDCTCNGHDPAGLAPVDISLDTTLRPGDILATSNGLVAYSGIRVGNSQTAEFTPVANYPGLTAEVRAKLGEVKVRPVGAEPYDGGPAVRGSVAPSAAGHGRQTDLD